MHNTQVLPTLFAKNKQNKILMWKIEMGIDQDGHYYLITRGQLGGNNETYKNHVKAKNIGKSNETTPFQQANAEAASRWEKKRNREGYFSIDDLGFKLIEEGGNVYSDGDNMFSLPQVLNTALPIAGITVNDYSLPMKAQPFWKTLKSGIVPCIKFPVYGQPKLNGVRCTMSLEKGKVVLSSKKGLRYDIPRHITDEMQTKIDVFNHPDIDKVVIDGEIYCHGMPLNEIVSAVRTHTLITAQLQFWAFDLAVPVLSQKERLIILRNIVWNNNFQFTKFLLTTKIYDLKAAELFAKDRLEEGYEGAIFREVDGEYIFGKRVSHIAKYKFRQENDFEIVEVIDTDNAPGLALFICRNDINEETFKAVPEGNHELRRKYFADKANLIGKMATVSYFDRSGVKEVPFHANVIVIRDYE